MGKARLVNIGDVYGYFTVIEFLPSRLFPSGQKRMFLCRCACGREKEVQAGNLFSGKSSACGALSNCPGAPIVNRFKEGTNRRMCYRAYIKKAKERNLSFELTEDEFLELSQKLCFYCASAPSNVYELKNKDGVSRCGEPFIYNGIDRVNNAKGYIPSNVVPCCKVCNRAKMTMSVQEFKNWIDAISSRKEVWYESSLASL